MKPLEDAGLTLNENKCVLGANTLKLFGHVFSSAGVSKDPENVKAVAIMTATKTPTEVRSLLGMVKYCSRIIPRLSQMVDPLRKLTHVGTEFCWNEQHQKAVDDVKEEISQMRTLAYFDHTNETRH